MTNNKRTIDADGLYRLLREYITVTTKAGEERSKRRPVESPDNQPTNPPWGANPMTDKTPTTIKINDLEYVRKDVAPQMAFNTDGLQYVIVRTYSAGVFAGYLKRRDGKEVDLVSARRLWRWAGANTLSDIAANGVGKPAECKFPLAVDVTLTEAIEILPATETARESIEGVPTWKS